MPRPCLRHLLLFVVLLFCQLAPTFSETLKIGSNPSGATVELNGVVAGTTPFEKSFPGGYFHRTRTVFGERMVHPMIARISLLGYATHEIALTEGPTEWIDLHGRNHGEYWTFKSAEFHVELDTAAGTFTGSIASNADAHVARGSSSFLAVLAGGLQLQTKVVYIDAELDIALAKVDAPTADFVFPCLQLADGTSVKQGESVLAIGNPGDAMLFSVTKGIVSAVGKFASAGPGIWIQTDAPINPGNSRGPLVNVRGEVIGLNTQKLIKRNVNGIGFTLSSSDLLTVLRRFYPAIGPNLVATQSSTETIETAVDLSAATESSMPGTQNSMPVMAPASSDGLGTVMISSEPDGAEIYIDGKFHGNTPATLKLGAGSHTVLLKYSGKPDYSRTLEIPKASKLTLKAVFVTSQP